MAAPAPEAPEAVDGRRVRREQNRDAVLDALVALFEEGIFQPSSNQIAERAGLSPRSLFRYFDDIDDLSRAAIERQLAAARPLLEVGAEAAEPTARKIEKVVAGRVRLFEATAPSARAARAAAHRRQAIETQVREARVYLRNQLRRLFAAELRGSRAELLPAVDALCSFETYELLRTQGLSRPKIIATLEAALGALLDPSGGHS